MGGLGMRCGVGADDCLGWVRFGVDWIGLCGGSGMGWGCEGELWGSWWVAAGWVWLRWVG